ncbi:peptidase A5 [Sulfolobus sp. A20]|uniref:thermopsin family protease n=1 Tax=Saccharolobus sp. A20 TaxID=1891280 RepID=UPI000845D6A1|nr:thermopsin family protease [Sulfolobus sp. A20]TRM73924.1 peptidase A5 [Sulfolobus sp. A20-N-F8]TRM76058.1 peptidase A5 [Sulfolobus sp. E5]TRM93695.1 peptidase A5 [Sulfolobus sp. A20-N-G8]TRM97681.1 peptidase A5 [Sulfolobus sp. F1]TRN00893.1 peptidase A5 [Sulfolobus sp. E1]
MYKIIPIIILLLSLLLPLTVQSQALIFSFPTGISSFPINTIIYTNFVQGEINITSLKIGDSYLQGQLLTNGNASLQLNAMILGKYWAQNVILFHQISSNTFYLTLIVNVWNLSGPFYNTTLNDSEVYQGLGIIYYQGPTFKESLPLHISLFMDIVNSTLQFGYDINNHKGIYFTLPIIGLFQIGGFSILGLPNDLELVWGGPGGGSMVYMNVTATTQLYYFNGKSLTIVPNAYSIGFDTAESAYGTKVNTYLRNIFSPLAFESPGINTPNILWPIPPQIKVNQTENKIYVNISINGEPIPDQEVYLETGFPPSVAAKSITNSSGIAEFSYENYSFYEVYFPGNYTLSSAYYYSSPILNSLTTKIQTYYQQLLNFLKSFQNSFKNGIKSVLSKQSPTTTTKQTNNQIGFNMYIIIYILAFVIGMVISAILIRFKL